MNSKKRIWSAILMILIGIELTAQPTSNIGIGIATPNVNAMLHVESNNKGLLIPRMTTAERTAIAPVGAGDAGIMVYDNDDNLFYYWNAAQWIPFPNTNVEDADSDPTNEYNTGFFFDSSTNILTITDGDGNLSVDLSSINTDTDTDDQTLSLSGTTLSIADGNSVNLISINTDDQTLSLSGTTLSIEDGNSVNLSSINTDTDDQTLSLSGTTLSISDGNSVNLSSVDTDTDDQTLSFSGTTLTIADGNSVNLSSLVDGPDNDWIIDNNDMYSGVSGNVGIGTSPSAGYKLHVAGKIKTEGITEISDKRLKTDIKPLENSLEKILAMRGVSYRWKASTGKPADISKIGLIAQEVEQLFPEVVDTDDKGYKSIQYSNLVAVLLEAIKSQQKIIEQYGSKVDRQENTINEMLGMLQGLQTDVEKLKRNSVSISSR